MSRIAVDVKLQLGVQMGQCLGSWSGWQVFMRNGMGMDGTKPGRVPWVLFALGVVGRWRTERTPTKSFWTTQRFGLEIKHACRTDTNLQTAAGFVLGFFFQDVQVNVCNARVTCPDV